MTFKITDSESSVDKRKEVPVLRWIREENYCGRTLLFGNCGAKVERVRHKIPVSLNNSLGNRRKRETML